ncbi:MAG: pitrilysin family protein [Acholeplasmataceae bacterium]
MKTIYNRRFDDTVYQIKLRNGMQVHILPKDKPFLSTFVTLSVPFGGLALQFIVDEKIETIPAGSAHFFEHKIFAMPNGEDAFSLFSSLGLDANAMTSYTETAYLFKTTNGLLPGLKLLLEMIDNPHFTNENIAVEKQIIAEELDMYLDDIDTVMTNNLYENMYHNHPIKHDIGGTKKSIQEIDKETLNRIYETFYQFNQRILVIAGNVDIKELRDFFHTYDQNNNVKAAKFKIFYPKEPKSVVKKHEVKQMPVFSPKLMLGFKLTSPKKTTEAIKEHIAAQILLNLLFGKSSSTYQQLLEEKLINSQFHCGANQEHNAFFIAFYAETKYPSKLKKAIANIIFNFEEYISQSAFERNKRSFIGQFIYLLNNVDRKAMLYASYLHKRIPLYDVLDIQQSITYEYVIEFARKIKKQNMASLIYIKPKLSKVEK